MGAVLKYCPGFLKKKKSPDKSGLLPTHNCSIASEPIFEHFMSVVNFFNYSAHHYLSKI